MNYRRTNLNAELEGKVFKYGDLELKYKEENIVSISEVAYEGYGHKAITFSNNITLYFRETSTQMYYFLSEELLGERYKTIYQRANTSDINFFDCKEDDLLDFDLIDITNYIEFENIYCKGYAFVNLNKDLAYIPIKDNTKMIKVDFNLIKNSLTMFEELGEFTTLLFDKVDTQEKIFNEFSSSKLFKGQKITMLSKFNCSLYIKTSTNDFYRFRTISEFTFVSKIKEIPKKANTIFKIYESSKRTNGVTDIIKNGSFDYFNW